MFAKSREQNLTPEALLCEEGEWLGENNSVDEPPEVKM